MPGTTYRQIGVKLWGEGAYERETMDGSQTKYAELFRAEAGDIIVNKIWARNGSVAVVPGALAGSFGSGEFPMFTPRSGLLGSRWMHWLTKTPTFWEQCDLKSQGTSGKNRIKPEQFLAVEIPLPPLAEQRRVVARIEELAAQIHEARTLRHQAAEEADALPTAETSRIFETLLRGERHPIETLGCDGENPIQIGPFGAQLHRTEFVENGTPVLNVGNVWPDGLKLDYLDHVTEEKAHQLKRYSIKTGDLLFARSGATLGKVCLVPPKCDSWLMTGHLFRVRFDPDRVFNRFAFAALRGSLQIQEQIFGQVRGATRPGYNTTLLGAVELPLPSIPEQRRIVAELDALQSEMDALKRLQAETAAELDALLPAILDRAFKGEL
jgi:type I restriction enzyme S subunit